MAAEAGFARPFIYSAQGFMEPAAPIDPFPVRVLSPAKNYDTGGMSVEGAILAEGHLGAILYGASAINQIRMEGEASPFATFRQLDPAWAVVEYNTASLLEPGRTGWLSGSLLPAARRPQLRGALHLADGLER